MQEKKLRIYDLQGELLMVGTVQEWREAVKAREEKRRIHAGTLCTSAVSSPS